MLGTILSAIAGAVLKHIRIAFERMAEISRAGRLGAAEATNQQRAKQDELSKKGRTARDNAESVDPDSVLDTDPDVRD